jgi:hemerythrin-like domain-containing protein
MKPTATERDSPKPSLHTNKGTVSDDDGRRQSPEVNRDNGESLAKVQELLFGAQFREHAQRISHLEASLTRVASEWKQELNSRFDSLESSVKQHVEALAAQIKSEHEGRAQSIAGLLHDLNELGKTVATSTAQLHQQASTESRELRQSIADQQQTLSTEIHQKNKELSNAMEAAVAELRREKVTRAALAELFAKSAQSLSGDLAQTRGK